MGSIMTFCCKFFSKGPSHHCLIYFLVVYIVGSHSSHLLPVQYDRNPGNYTAMSGVFERDYFAKSDSGLWEHLKLQDGPSYHSKSYTVFLDLLKKKTYEPKHPRYRNNRKKDSKTFQLVQFHNRSQEPKKGQLDSSKHEQLERNLQNMSDIAKNRDNWGQNAVSRSHSVGLKVHKPDINTKRPPSVKTSVTVLPTAEFSTGVITPSQDGNRSISLIDKMITWKDAQRRKFYTIAKESPLWLGVGAGICSSVVLVMLGSLVYILLRKRRTRCSKLRELSMGTPKEDKPIYIKLSQLHRPKRSPNYVVTVLDESNFSIDSEDDTSEEELFDLSAISDRNTYKTSLPSNKVLHYQNKTSTPKKNNNRPT